MRVPTAFILDIGSHFIRKSLNSDSLPESLATSRFIAAQLKTLFMQTKFGIISKRNIKKAVWQVLSNIESIKTCIAKSNASPKMTWDGQAPSESVQTGKRLLLSFLIQKYSEEHILAKRWTLRTQNEFKPVFELFLEIVGDIDVKELNQKVIMDYRDKLSNVPVNRNKLKKFKGMSLNELLKLKSVKHLHLKTINNSLSLISSLLKWGARLGYIQRNFADGLSYNIKTRPADERKIYSTDDLKRLVSELRKIDSARRPERYWIPIIALFSGIRQNEICQMQKTDIIQISGIWCFDVNQHEDGKSLKTISSQRIVPIHNVILKLGFLKFVSESTQGQLWKNLKYYQCRGYAHSFKKWYLPFNRQKITSDSKKTFHSFRHNVADGLKQLGVDSQLIAEILGHKTGSITLERYGKNYKPEVLKAVIDKIDYGFDIIREFSAKF